MHTVLWDVQGVPWNMTIARRLFFGIWIYLWHLVFIYFNMNDSWNNYHIILLALAFPKSGLRFLCFQYFWRYKEFGSDFNSKKPKKSERNSSYLGQYWKHNKGRPHFGNGRTRRIIISRNLLLKFKNQIVLHTVLLLTYKTTPTLHSGSDWSILLEKYYSIMRAGKVHLRFNLRNQKYNL